MSTTPKAAVAVEFLRTDTSNPVVRGTWCWAFLTAGPLMAAAYTSLLSHPGFLAFCLIASPVTGLCGSALWLAWPWMRLDMEGARWRLVLNDRDGAEPDDPNNGSAVKRAADVADAVFKRLSDRAERGSYRFVGATLALSCLFALPPAVVSSNADPDAVLVELASVRRDLGDAIGGLRRQLMAVRKAQEESGRSMVDQLAALREQVRLQAEELASLKVRLAPPVGASLPPMPAAQQPEPGGARGP